MKFQREKISRGRILPPPPALLGLKGEKSLDMGRGFRSRVTPLPSLPTPLDSCPSTSEVPIQTQSEGSLVKTLQGRKNFQVIFLLKVKGLLPDFILRVLSKMSTFEFFTFFLVCV